MAWPFDNQVDSVLPIDYGVQKLASYANNAMGNNRNLKTWPRYDRNNTSALLPNNQNISGQLRGYNNYDGAQEYNPNFGQSFAGVGRFDPRNMIRPDNLTQDLGASTYQAPPPSQLNTLDPNWQNELAGYGSTMDRGNIDQGFLSGITGPVMGGLKWLGEKFKRPEAKQRAYEEIMKGGTYKGKGGYELYETPSGLKIGSDILGTGQGYAKNFDSMFGSRSIEEMEQKKLDWAEKRFNKLGRRGLGTRIYNELLKSGRISDQPTKTITTDTVSTGGTDGPNVHGGGSEASFTRTSPGGISQAVSRAARTDQSGNVMSGWRLAEGGRPGYQEGELVEDEYMAEATPGGMMEENIEEVQGEPSREQLEAIAFEIFRLPLEQLNEQQLEVVYQAAMEQEPSEEEVQFAAQEGPGEGIASLV